MKKNPYERIKHGFDRFPTSPPIATTDRVGGFLLEENGDFVLDKLGHLKLANSGGGGGGGGPHVTRQLPVALTVFRMTFPG